jgi:hypothetical protein
VFAAGAVVVVFVAVALIVIAPWCGSAPRLRPADVATGGKPKATSRFLGVVKLGSTTQQLTLDLSATVCAGAWNRHASAQQLLTIAQEHPLTATVTGNGRVFTHVLTSSSSGATSTSPTGSGCAILFFLPNDRITSAFGAVAHGTVSIWQGPIAPQQAHPAPTQLGPEGNASVRADGTVHFHG